MDLCNPWIVLHKEWIHDLYDDPWIACSIHGLLSAKGAKLGFAQNMDWPKLHVKRGYVSIAPLPSFVFSMKFC